MTLEMGITKYKLTQKWMTKIASKPTCHVQMTITHT